ncbi:MULTISPECIES: thermonuclease family protein [Halocynthiibacter]|uniref:TNase-like domain-containing protein n=1 Tax=Halocynthiibacter halioticoli TaxID=2986804 RepID=A0AAE3LSK9_9RHOB|nr:MULTISPECIES: hypothetical protein [Halocynthiibacter]MCV6825674.1 hypothetical protein [Halocynthiibacter halioticoli]MCW4058675.1 hypothetical protein [Halocynthiibacter sp. SDUM655004]
MPFSQQKLEEVQKGIRLALASTTLNEWERNFLRDMQAKLDRFGRSTRLSGKQYRRLIQLVDGGGNIALSRSQPGRRMRPKYSTRDWRPTTGGALVVAACLGFVAFKAAERFPEYLGHVVSLTATKTISGRVTRVRDGDTIEVSGVPIRFGSLDCAEANTSEGQRATARMRTLVVGQRLTCHLNGRTSYDRKIGSCQMNDGRDLAGVMISEGFCGRFW